MDNNFVVFMLGMNFHNHSLCASFNDPLRIYRKMIITIHYKCAYGCLLFICNWVGGVGLDMRVSEQYVHNMRVGVGGVQSRRGGV